MTLADVFRPGTFLDAFRFIGDNPVFLLQKAAEQLELAGAALGIALAVALPLGIVLGHLRRGSTVAIGASIVGRALPSLVLIGVLLTVLGIGFVNNMVALAVLAAGPLLTNGYEAVAGVDQDAVEAARGMGLTSRQILLRIRLPLAVPAIVGGLRIAVVSTISIATIAAFLGRYGLGYPIFLALKEPTPFRTEIYSAGALAVGLALACDATLVLLRRLLAPWAARRLA